MKTLTRSKFHNKRTYCLSMHRHDSMAEANYCNILLADKKLGRLIDFKIQVPFSIGAGIKHIVDFEVQYADRLEVHEVKGFQTSVWKLKHKLFLDKYPHIKYVIIFRK